MKNKTQQDYNRKRREEIMLGQAMNQALNFLVARKWNISDKEAYKDVVRDFFEWNKELYAEHFEQEETQ